MLVVSYFYLCFLTYFALFNITRIQQASAKLQNVFVKALFYEKILLKSTEQLKMSYI